MVTSDRKVRMLMESFQKTGSQADAALDVGVDRKTARKYLRRGLFPSQMRREHTWRTRSNPFAPHWAEVEALLQDTAELEAKTLFEWLCTKHPGIYGEGQLRTFQRHVRWWRALEGPSQEVFFPQAHKPGERMQTDFTCMNSLEVTICREPFPHLFCHTVLPYSNWEWGRISYSESFLALKGGFQESVRRLGHIPREHWTDHSTGATHQIEGGEGGNRGFNRPYLDLMHHYGIEPRTIQVASPNENGDVESLNGVFKRRVNQHLLLRGRRDFDSKAEYVVYLDGIMEKANQLRRVRIEEELAVMRLLKVDLLPEYFEEDPRVTSWSTVQVARNTYSVPSRLIGSKVKARVYDERVEIHYHGVKQLNMPRLRGEGKHAVNYRHVIGSLLRKPGAFRHYKYREDMFPTPLFRWAYDALGEGVCERAADLEYLRILHHAAHTMESKVEAALQTLQDAGRVPRWEAVLALTPVPKPEPPILTPLKVDLTEYDRLIESKEVSA